MKVRLLKRAAFAAMTAALSLQPFAVGFDTIPFWTGTGTNSAALVIHWSAPEVRNGTSVPNPIAEASLAWGYRFNGAATAEEMLRAILQADPRLFAAINVSQFGASVLGLGYDLNNNRVFGLQYGTNILAPAAFTNGVASLPTARADEFRSLDPGDLFWSGWNGAGWENWNEPGNSGGLTNAPDRGSSTYWMPGDPTQPYFGNHGGWELAGFGISQLPLKDGSWVGMTVAGGGFDFMNMESPGTLAYSFKKQAPVAPAWAPQVTSPFAVEVTAGQGPFGAAPYDEPGSVLGMPSTDYYDPFGDFAGGTKNRRVKIVEAVFGTDARTNKLITTLEENSSIVVRFDQPVTNNPANPYGVDFLVFGNSFYPSDGFINDAADLNTTRIMGGLFSEPMKVSVSPGYTGQAGEEMNNPSTWPWHRFETGPYADGVFPTQGYYWNRAETNWSPRPMDFTKPVNPAFAALLDAGNIPAADAIDLYNGSGGGTGFDLSASGFSSIRYARVEGIGMEFSAGEIDAFAVVRPSTIGDTIALGPQNLTNAQNEIYFQDPISIQENRVKIAFETLSENAQVSVTPATFENFVSASTLIQSADLAINPLLGSNGISFRANATLSLSGLYQGQGTDLNVLQRDGTNWVAAPQFTYNAASNAITLAGLTNNVAVAVERVGSPDARIAKEAGAFGLQFAPVVGWVHTLERTTNFVDWTVVTNITVEAAKSSVIKDENTLAGGGFYRLRVTRP